MAMKQTMEKLRKASESFQKRHEFKEGMAVNLKKELSGTNPGVGIFMYYLPNGFGGEDDHPLHPNNFLIADCVVMTLNADGLPQPALSDSRFLEPIVETDERQLQLGL
jgi:hypothetical protein